MKSESKARLIFLCAIAVLTTLGLLSRKVVSVPAFVGDALWAMVVYCCWKILLIKKTNIIPAIAALITSFAVELSQLINWDWLNRLRTTFIGHMLLGQGFQYSDLLAYTIGIAIIFVLTTLLTGLFLKNR